MPSSAPSNQLQSPDRSQPSPLSRQSVGSSTRWIILNLLVDHAKNSRVDVIVPCPDETAIHNDSRDAALCVKRGFRKPAFHPHQFTANAKLIHRLVHRNIPR